MLLWIFLALSAEILNAFYLPVFLFAQYLRCLVEETVSGPAMAYPVFGQTTAPT